MHHEALSGRVRESILRNTPRNRLSCERLVFLELVEEDGACEVRVSRSVRRPLKENDAKVP